MLKDSVIYDNKKYDYVILSDVETASGAKYNQLNFIDELFLLANDDSIKYYNLDRHFYGYIPADILKSNDESFIKDFIKKHID